MPIPIKLPNVGAAGRPLYVSAWYVEPGDDVSVGESFLEVRISGVTCDVPAPVAGKITHLEKDLNAEVRPGEVVAWIDPET